MILRFAERIRCPWLPSAAPSAVILLLLSFRPPAQAGPPADIQDALAGIADKVRPAVVIVTCEREVARLRILSTLTLGSPHRSSARIINNSSPIRTKIQRSVASGFAIDDQGHIVTVPSALNLGGRVMVQLLDGQKREARIVGVDEVASVAVIKTDPSDLMPVPFAGSANLRVGQWVATIANPYGLQGSVSAGAVSGLRRYVEGRSRAHIGLIQITNPIHPGELGGALADLNGRVIGMLCFSHHRPVEGGHLGMNVSFGVPAERILRSARQIIAGGKAVHGWLGVSVREPGDGSQGAVIARIHPDSPLRQAGFLPGDQIIRFREAAVVSPRELQALVFACDPETEAKMSALRGGKELQASVRLARAPEGRLPAEDGPKSAYLGAGLRELTDHLRGVLGVTNRGGVLVAETIVGAPAASDGMQPGDVVLKLGGEPVLSLKHWQDRFSSCRPEQDVMIEVCRKGIRIPLRVRLAAPPPGSQVTYVQRSEFNRYRTSGGLEEELFRMWQQMEALRREVESLRSRRER